MTEHVDAAPAATDPLMKGMERMITVSADRVFRDPVHVGETVVIPAAAITYAGGFGYGLDVNQNVGGGGGGWNDGRPVAVVEAGPAGVRVRPVFDATKIGLAVIAAALTVWRASRRG